MRGRRAGLVLLTVLMMVTISALVGATIVYLAGGEVAATRTVLRRTQARALAWSGVQAVMSELSAHREELLDGEGPHVTEEWSLFADGSGTGVSRVAAAKGQLLIPESAKLPLNTATAEMLEKLPMLDATLARRIVEARGNGYASVEELARVEGITPALLYGSTVGGGQEGGLPAGDEADALGADAGADAVEAAPDDPTALIDVLTVFEFDPNVQAGLGEDGPVHRGRKRININAEWSSELGRAITDRFGEGVAEGLHELMTKGQRFTKPSEMVRFMRQIDVPPEEWVAVLDAFTASPDPYVLGRVDLNTGPAVVLACLPGIDRSAADAIVAAREQTDVHARRSVVWPVLVGLLTEEQFEQAVDYLTTRSMQWRVRIEAGVLPPDEFFGGMRLDEESPAPLDLFDEDDIGGTLRPGGADDLSGKLRDRIVLEAVVDVAGQRPRVAYLRDVTLMPVAAALYAESSRLREELAAPEDEFGTEPAWGGDWTFQDPLDWGNDAGFEDRSFAGESADDEGDAPGMGPDADSGDGFGPEAGLDFDPSLDLGPDPGRSDAAESAAPETGGSAAAAPGKDRRIGRWTSGGDG